MRDFIRVIEHRNGPAEELILLTLFLSGWGKGSEVLLTKQSFSSVETLYTLLSVCLSVSLLVSLCSMISLDGIKQVNKFESNINKIK